MIKIENINYSLTKQLSEIVNQSLNGTKQDKQRMLLEQTTAINNLGINSFKSNIIDEEGAINCHTNSLSYYISEDIMLFLKENFRRKHNWLIDSEFIIELIKRGILVPVPPDTMLKVKDITVYFNQQKRPLHSGVIGTSGKIESKWGVLPDIFEHKIQEVPYLDNESKQYYIDYYTVLSPELNEYIMRCKQDYLKGGGW